jgi:hypothetical protein
MPYFIKTGFWALEKKGFKGWLNLNDIIGGGGGGPITIENSGSLFSTALGAGTNSLANNSNFLGNAAGNGATNANNSNFFGTEAGKGATNAEDSNFFGNQAGFEATDASGSNFFGNDAGNGASNANSSNFFGIGAGQDATNANNSNFFGIEAGEGSSGNNVNAFGAQAGQGNALDGQTIFSNTSMPTFADHAAAAAAITVALGASAGDTYLYHNQATNSIGAVRL